MALNQFGEAVQPATGTGRPAMTLGDWWWAASRRAKLMTRVGAGIAVAGILLALLWPATYRASGTILIEQQEVPTDLVRSTISSYADQRIQMIQQQVMTTDNLFKIIQKYDLYATDRRRRTREYVLEEMRNDIGFSMISADVIDPRSGSPTKATIAFAISYQARTPELAAKVANELVSLYLQQNIDSRKQRAADATTFLGDESQRLDREIHAQQAALETFKNRHLNELPELTGTNIQLMTRSGEELREADTQLRALDQQITFLDAQLAQINPVAQVYASTGERVMSPADRLKFMRSEYARLQAIYAPDHPDVVRVKRMIEGLERSVNAADGGNDLRRELEDARSQLATARQRYSSEHPDVVRLQRVIASVEAQLAQAKPATPAVDPAADNPAYIQINAQREAAVNDRKALQAKREQLAAVGAGYERRLAAGPAVERQYSTMLRDLEDTQLKYREVRQKMLAAEVAQNLETERKGERFTLIEPPLAPELPYSPNRVLILALALVLGVAGAVGALLAAESASPVVRDRRDLEALVGVAPLAVLPVIVTEADRARGGSRQRFVIVGAVASLALALLAVHWFYRPLDVLWQVLLRRVAG